MGRLKIDLKSPKTAFVLVAILFLLMVISAYCGQKEKKFIRTKSGRLTTKVPTKKVKKKAKKKAVTQTSSLLPSKIKKALVSKKGDKTLKINSSVVKNIKKKLQPSSTITTKVTKKIV